MAYYDILAAQKAKAPPIGTEDASGVTPTDDGSLIVTIGEVQGYISFPRIVFVSPDSRNPIQTFRTITLKDFKTYAENIDAYHFAPRGGQQEVFGFHVMQERPGDESRLLYGQGTVTGVVEGVKIALVE
ncbi:uncharacterized protein DSM5745_05974 [Aspergillus mulundensis]|uniref:Uncharacterized protein n=1 Tax=Aspergillus mulundensis TaxID=1810919 RepID=A0A3D8RYJ7_9EURO|nr:hypothetical protein DSM5745_05974 [Aspergillus mulundensis]RDW79122.1 hypothetical protein DSM5745_05974 [Aspergillus mulundensis]